MDKTILQYQISDWSQLSKCKSNTSPDLKIVVSNYVQNIDIEGLNIAVTHPVYGILFSYTIFPKGKLIYKLDPEEICIIRAPILLNELKRYGFFVDYVEEENLSKELVEFLETLKGFNFNKLRRVSVHDDSTYQQIDNYIAAFNIADLPGWINSPYSPSKKEWEQALINGHAFNISGLEYAKKFNWNWCYNAIYDINQLIYKSEKD